MDSPADLTGFCVAEYPRLVRALSLYCGSREVAEDAVQEALIRACEQWPKIRVMASPSGYVFTVATNQLRSHYRRAAVAARLFSRPTRLPTAPAGSDELVMVRQAVAGLPHRQRQAIVLRHFLAMTVEETAQIMGASQASVRSLTHRALTTMRTELRSLDLDEFPERNDGN